MSFPKLLTKRRLPHLTLLIGLAVFDAALMVIISRLISNTLSWSGGGYGADTIGWLVGAASLSAVLFVSQRVLSERISLAYAKDIRLKLFNRILTKAQLGAAYSRTGTEIARLVGDVNSVRDWVGLGVCQSISATVQLIGGSIALVLVAPVLAGFILVCLTVLWLSAVLTVYGKMRFLTIDMRKRRGALAGHMGDVVSAPLTVLQYGSSRQERKRLETRSDQLMQTSTTRQLYASTLTAFSIAMVPVGLAISILGIEILYPDGRPQVFDWGTLVFVLGIISVAFMRLSIAVDFLIGYRVARKRLTDLISLPHPALPAGRIRTFPEQAPQTPALRILYRPENDAPRRVTVNPGETCAITGAVGSGKTHFARALSGLTTLPDKMRVSVKGIRWKRLSPRALRHAVCLVSPDVPLLGGTVSRTLGLRSASGQRPNLRHVLEACNLTTEQIATLLKPDMRIAEGGKNLSSGMAARLRLARALARQPQILIIDEPELTSTKPDLRHLATLSSRFAGPITTIIMLRSVPHGLFKKSLRL